MPFCLILSGDLKSISSSDRVIIINVAKWEVTHFEDHFLAPLSPLGVSNKIRKMFQNRGLSVWGHPGNGNNDFDINDMEIH